MKGVEIVFQNKDFLVLNKPAGLLVHGAPYFKEKQPTLVDWLVKNFPQVKKVGDDPIWRPGIVHRLDKETSGALLVCLHQESFDYFKNLFAQRQIKKTYLAVVRGQLKNKTGVINLPLGIKKGTTKRTIFSSKMTKEAITEYKVLKEFKKGEEWFSLLEIMPLTGRTHQIRVHLNFLNHPVVGDKIYGGKKNASLASRLMLHAFSLEFSDWHNQRYKIEAPLPDDFSSFLGFDFDK